MYESIFFWQQNNYYSRSLKAKPKTGKTAPTTTMAPKPVSQDKKKSQATPSTQATQTDIRDHFPERKSTRRKVRRHNLRFFNMFSHGLDQDQQTEDDVRQMMRKQEEPGLQSVDIAGKGKGVINTKPFSKGDYVCEYAGELMSKAEGMAREKKYAEVSTSRA